MLMPTGYITGWLNELAFVPVDCKPDAMEDEWSLRHRLRREVFLAGRRYQARSRARASSWTRAFSPAEKLKVVQKLMEEGDLRAAAIYRSIGVYLAHSLALLPRYVPLPPCAAARAA